MSTSLPRPDNGSNITAERFESDPRQFLESVQQQFEDLVAVSIPGLDPLVVVTNPQLVHEILHRTSDFPRTDISGATEGLFQSERNSKVWRQKRSLTSQAFSGVQIARYANTVGKQIENLPTEWQSDLSNRNIHAEMTAHTVRAASKVLLRKDIGQKAAKDIHNWMQDVGRHMEFSLTLAPAFFRTPSREFKEVPENVRAIFAKMMNDDFRTQWDEKGVTGEHDAEKSVNLPEWVPSIKGNDYPMSPEQVLDLMLTLLIAGHETTALSLTYTWALLSWHPEVRSQVREEAHSVLGQETPQHYHLSELDYTMRVFREAIRLYPPTWAIFRSTEQEVPLGEYKLPSNATVILPQWSIHRDPRYFKNPSQFNPDRWERQELEHNAYFPFSSGPHVHIGRQFVLSGAPLTLAGLVRDFNIEIAHDALSKFQATPTLRPRGPVRGQIAPVDTNASENRTIVPPAELERNIDYFTSIYAERSKYESDVEFLNSEVASSLDRQRSQVLTDLARLENSIKNGVLSEQAVAALAQSLSSACAEQYAAAGNDIGDIDTEGMTTAIEQILKQNQS